MMQKVELRCWLDQIGITIHTGDDPGVISFWISIASVLVQFLTFNTNT